MRCTIHRILPILLIIFCTTVSQTPVAASLTRGSTPTLGYLTLDVTPAPVTVGSLVTLHITYHGDDVVFINIVLDPDDALRFDPPRSSGCPYYECSEFTFRTQKTGVASIQVNAGGEIYDTDCGCWRFTNVSGYAAVIIRESRVLLPVVRH